MPADYESTAQALSLPISPRDTSSPSPSPTSHAGPAPPWARDRSSSTNARRLSTPYSRPSVSDEPLGARMLRTSTGITNWILRAFVRLTPLQRVAAVAACLVLTTLTILSLVYTERIFGALEPVASGWRALPAGWLILWFMTFATAFPPMIGYSTTITIAGFVYGFPGGWPIVASATVAGSTVAFFTSRTVFSKYVHRLVGQDRRFVALGQVLRHDGLLVLAGIRFCPLPYSLSNGFLATIPSIHPLSFALATGLASPKLLVHVFIGDRLKKLAEEGDEMTAGAKAVNYISMILGGLVGLAVGLFVYRRTMARAKELAREEAAENGGVIDPEGETDYEGLEEGVLSRRESRQGEADAAALMDDDDISLWESDPIGNGYRDDDDQEVTDHDTHKGMGR